MLEHPVGCTMRYYEQRQTEAETLCNKAPFQTVSCFENVWQNEDTKKVVAHNFGNQCGEVISFSCLKPVHQEFFGQVSRSFRNFKWGGKNDMGVHCFVSSNSADCPSAE